MRASRVVRLIVAVAILICFSFAAGAQTDPDQAQSERAIAVFNKGNTAGALAMVESVLAHSPNHENALFYSAMCNFHLGNVEAARGRLERLVKVSGNFFAAWELMVQVTQAQGDLARRDEAIARLKIAITTAIDPAIRDRSDFVRDRIPVGDDGVSGVDYFARSGSDFTRYQFNLGDPRLDPDHGIMLRTDQATTENWSETALLPPDTQLFHLDLVYPRPQGGDDVAIYQYYVGEPDYDTVRAEVLKILRGEVQPLSGDAGTLAGILKR